MFLDSGVGDLYLSGFRFNIVYTFEILGAFVFGHIFVFVEVVSGHAIEPTIGRQQFKLLPL